MLTFRDAALYCEEVFGSFYNREENFFECPECGEPIYECDWRDYGWWDTCPICETYFAEVE